jgi:hypothetical protein
LRILGWSAAVLALALSISTITTHIVLMKRVDPRVSSELSHERDEFNRVLLTDSGMSPVETLRATLRRSVPERTLALIGVLNHQIVARSRSATALSFGSQSPLLAQWSAATAPTTGSITTDAEPVSSSPSLHG